MTLYTAEKSLKDAEGKISDDIKNGVQSKIDALKGVKDGIDGDAIKKATEELSGELSKIGEAMNKASQEQPQSEPKQEETVRDAEVNEGDNEANK